MARSKKTRHQKQSYETLYPESFDPFLSLYNSMMLSEAWFDLTAKQQCLYNVCKMQQYATKDIDNDKAKFYMNKTIWMNKYHLYNDGNENGFYRDMSELIMKGFIICVFSGKESRTKSVYQLYDMWHKYKTDEFTILPKHMNKTLIKRHKII